jgi:4-hydroxythreonine-4-phosphate dehydrogenase
MKHVLVLTPGEGIGPEITAKIVLSDAFPEISFIIIGNIIALERAAQGRALPPRHRYEHIDEIQAGACCFKALDRAVTYLKAGLAEALVTGPISKANLHAAGYSAHGHTEILEALATQYYPDFSGQSDMLFQYKKLRMLLLTRHIPLYQVSQALDPQKIRQSLFNLMTFCPEACPQIAILGINPHAGELDEAFEERDILQPLITAFNQSGQVKIHGPFAADAFFRGFSVTETPYQAIVSGYHDQGLIPFKMLAGYEAVNITIGLPFIRTSVSHGTAFDIEGQGVARTESLVAAIEEACRLVSKRESV